MADIFFSYAPEDEPRVRQLAEALKAQGLNADCDRRVLPGQSIRTEIDRRLDAAKAVVAVWSVRSVGLEHLRDEASYATESGKLVPVRIDPVESPIGFRQLECADLAGWPGVDTREGLLSLTQALCAKLGLPIPAKLKALPFAMSAASSFAAMTDGVPDAHMQSGRFLRSGSFWGWSTVIALLSGLLYFLSPLGVEEMGESVPERLGTMIGNTLGAFIIVGLAQALIHWSRAWVGKRGPNYFSIEFLIFAAIAATLAAITFNDPEQQRDSGGGLIGFLHQFNFMFLGALLIFAPLLALVRGVIRLGRGKPRHA